MPQRSNAARFSRTVLSDPAPPATYANASSLIASLAAASSRPASTGTVGVFPATPAR